MKQAPENMNFSTEKFSGVEEGGKEKKKKGKSKRFGSSVLPLVESSESVTPKAETTKQSSADKILAEIAFARDKREKQEAEEEQKEAKEAPKDTSSKETIDSKKTVESGKTETTTEMAETAETPDTVHKSHEAEATTPGKDEANQKRDKLAETFSTDYGQEIKANELPPSKLFSEGVIDLGQPDEEIIALREEDQPKPIAWTQQPGQQHFARQEVPEGQSANEPAVSPEVPEQATLADAHETAAPDSRAANAETSAARPDNEVEPPAAVPTQPSSYNTAQAYSRTYNQPPPPPNPNVPLPPNPNSNQQSPLNPNVAFPNPNVINPLTPNVLQNPNIQPVTPPLNPNQQPPVPSNKNQYVTKQEMEDEVYYATKYGQRRGVIAGVIAGGWWEHRKHKKREKRQAKEFAKQTKVFEKERENVQFENNEQRSLLNEKDRQLRELQTAAERQKQTTPLTAAETQRSSVSAETARPHNKQAEAKDFNARLEQLIPKRPEKASKDREIAEATLEIPEDHHLETSAWHTIEVDSKTGKAVENPTFAYGEEYYHERAKEMNPRTTNQKHAAGEVAIVAASLEEGPAQQSGGQTASGQAPSDASTQQRTSVREMVAAKAKEAYQAGKKAAKGTGSQQNSGPLWPWLVAFGVVVILLIAVL